MTDAITVLASYRHTVERIRERWSAFLARRADRLQQHGRFGGAAEKVATDIVNGGRRPGVFAPLDASDAPLALWWLSVQGIWRSRTDTSDALLREPAELPIASDLTSGDLATDARLLHPKYKIPCDCFAYVGDARKLLSRKLPYRHADGSVDVARLQRR
jgi:hypothetical protein